MKNNIVYLRGAFTAPNGGLTASGLVVPTGYRISADQSFPISTNSTATMMSTVKSNGVIETWTSATTSSWFSIAGISYPLG